jgi:hypothetical protein
MRIELQGDVVDLSELLNGTRQATLEGAGQGWTLTARVAWRIGLDAAEGEGELTLSRDGDELYATVVAGEASEGEDGSYCVTARVDVDGGAGAFEGASGTGVLRITLTEETFTGSLDLSWMR